MNCFEWQSRASDYLDGDLPEAVRREAEDHVQSCKACTERSKHFRVILSSIASQPRSALPAAIRKAPLAVVVPRLEAARIGRSRWEQVPWYVRTPLEGTGIVLLILLGISTGPKIRALYEKNIERSLSDFTDALTSGDFSFRHGLHQEDLPPLAEQMAATTDPAKHDDIAGEDEEDEEEEESPAVVSKDLHIGKSDMFRIILKTSSPYELRPQVYKILTDLKVSPDMPGLGGQKFPGGIGFDLELPSSIVAEMRDRLEKLAPESNPTDDPEAQGGRPFRWFRVKSKRRLPEGKTRVVIFLNQF